MGDRHRFMLPLCSRRRHSACLPKQMPGFWAILQVQGPQFLCHQRCYKHAERDHDQWPYPGGFHGVQELHVLQIRRLQETHLGDLARGWPRCEDCWWGANSWGTTWGLEGYFKMARGNNACGMESMGPPYAGLPQMEPDNVFVL